MPMPSYFVTWLFIIQSFYLLNFQHFFISYSLLWFLLLNYTLKHSSAVPCLLLWFMFMSVFYMLISYSNSQANIFSLILWLSGL